MNNIGEIKNLQANAGFSIIDLRTLKDKLQISIPIENIESFNELEEKLKDTDLKSEVVSN